MSGGGGLAVTGTGQTLSGNNTFTGGLTVNTGAMLTLTGSNGFSGGTTLSGGTLNYTNAVANLGASGNTITFQNNGTLLYSGSVNVSPTTTVPLAFSGNGTVAVSNSSVNVYFESTNITGTGTMTKTGFGELQYGSGGSGQNGPIVVAQGTFMETSPRIANVTGLTVLNGGQFEIMDDQNNDAGQGANFSTAAGAVITLNGKGYAGTGGAFLYTPQSYPNQGVALVTNNIVLQTDSSIVVCDSPTNTFKLRLTGNISGTGSLIKDYLAAVPAGRGGEVSLFQDSMGILALGGSNASGYTDNTYTGNTIINSGTILLQSTSALPVTTNVYIDALHNSTLDLGGCDGTITGLFNGPNGGGTITNSGTNQIAAASNATLTVIGGGSYAGVIKDGAYPTGLTMAGTGVLALGGSNTYSGGTELSSGTLQVGSNSPLGLGAVSANGGVLDLAGNSPTIGSLGGIAGTITNSGSNAVTLSVNQSAVTSFSGTLQDGEGTLALVANGSGSGALWLTGTNTYSGGTTLSSGRLVVTSPASLGNTVGAGLDQCGNAGGRQRLLRDAKHRSHEPQRDDPGRCRPDLYEFRPPSPDRAV